MTVMTGARGGDIELRDFDQWLHRPAAPVDEIGDDVGVVERCERLAAHGAMQRVARMQEPWRVVDDELRVFAREDPDDALARGLRLGAR